MGKTEPSSAFFLLNIEMTPEELQAYKVEMMRQNPNLPEAVADYMIYLYKQDPKILYHLPDLAKVITQRQQT
jgi:hypothetical protein